MQWAHLRQMPLHPTPSAAEGEWRWGKPVLPAAALRDPVVYPDFNMIRGSKRVFKASPAVCSAKVVGQGRNWVRKMALAALFAVQQQKINSHLLLRAHKEMYRRGASRSTGGLCISPNNNRQSPSNRISLEPIAASSKRTVQVLQRGGVKIVPEMDWQVEHSSLSWQRGMAI